MITVKGRLIILLLPRLNYSLYSNIYSRYKIDKIDHKLKKGEIVTTILMKHCVFLCSMHVSLEHIACFLIMPFSLLYFVSICSYF